MKKNTVKKIHKSGEICLPAATLGKLMNLPPERVGEMRLTRITQEFAKGFHFLRNYGKSATFFGSARCIAGDKHYEEARKLASLLAGDGFAIITGGGPGIMEAANKGAVEAGGQSAGINIQLGKTQNANPYVKESVSFYYFFARKVMLSFASEVYIFFAGGFGTLDEFFELVTLVQTRKIDPIPIILVGEEYWNPLIKWIAKDLYEKRKNIDKEDMKIYRVVKDATEAAKIIKKLVKKDNIRTV
ncbi:MAG: TIGR00730 family Rossman fold protein [bacterium]|nr:TIGR00730 family Rossman fold protein [bacterium]